MKKIEFLTFINNDSTYELMLKNLKPELKNDKYFIMSILEKKYNVFKYLSKEMQEDKEIFIKFLKHCNQLWFISDNELIETLMLNKLLLNKDVVLELLEINRTLFKYLSKEMQEDKEILVKFLRLNSADINNELKEILVSNKLLLNKDVVLELLEIRVEVFKYLSKEMQEDKEVFVKFLRFGKSSFICDELKEILVSNKLLSDRDVALELLEIDSTVFKYLSKEMQEDKEVFSKFLRFCNTPFIDIEFKETFESNKLLSNKEEVLELLETNSWLFPCLSKEMQEDKEILVHFLKVCMYSLLIFRSIGNELASNKLLLNKDVVLELLEIRVEVFECLSKEMQEDKEVFVKFLKTWDGRNIETFVNVLEGNKLLQNKEVVFELLEIRPELIFPSLSSEMRNDSEIISKFVDEQNFLKNAIPLYDFMLKTIDIDIDKYFIESIDTIKLFLYNDYFPKYFEKYLNDKQYVLQLIDANIYVYEFLDEKLKNDKDILNRLFSKIKNSKEDKPYHFITKYVVKNLEIAKIAVENDYSYYYLLNSDFRNEIDKYIKKPDEFKIMDEEYAIAVCNAYKWSAAIDNYKKNNVKENESIDIDSLINRIDSKIAQLDEEEILEI